uniref:RING-type domain-containing protein n=1 Tax=Oryza barthii TaxID=65489 RepID=A0A0D3FA18_9ORYZ
MAAGATLSVLLLVAGVVLMLVLHVVVVFWALRRGVFLRGAFRVEERRDQRAAGLTPDEIAVLPCHERKEAAHDVARGGLSAEQVGELPCHVVKEGGGECAVCLEAFQAGDRCRVLPRCEHGFHARCVDSWLRQSRVCPICRAEVEVSGYAGKPAAAVAEARDNSNVFLVAGLSLVVVVHVLVLLWALWWGYGRSRLALARARVVGQHDVARGGLSAEQVGELPCHVVKEGAGECAVCLEAFRAGDRRRVLPRCEHGFHAQCVDSWLRVSRLCPICRAEVAASRGKEGDAPVAEAASLEIVAER